MADLPAEITGSPYYKDCDGEQACRMLAKGGEVGSFIIHNTSRPEFDFTVSCYGNAGNFISVRYKINTDNSISSENYGKKAPKGFTYKHKHHFINAEALINHYQQLRINHYQQSAAELAVSEHNRTPKLDSKDQPVQIPPVTTREEKIPINPWYKNPLSWGIAILVGGLVSLSLPIILLSAALIGIGAIVTIAGININSNKKSTIARSSTHRPLSFIQIDQDRADSRKMKLYDKDAKDKKKLDKSDKGAKNEEKLDQSDKGAEADKNQTHTPSSPRR